MRSRHAPRRQGRTGRTRRGRTAHAVERHRGTGRNRRTRHAKRRSFATRKGRTKRTTQTRLKLIVGSRLTAVAGRFAISLRREVPDLWGVAARGLDQRFLRFRRFQPSAPTKPIGGPPLYLRERGGSAASRFDVLVEYHTGGKTQEPNANAGGVG